MYRLRRLMWSKAVQEEQPSVTSHLCPPYATTVSDEDTSDAVRDFEVQIPLGEAAI